MYICTIHTTLNHNPIYRMESQSEGYWTIPSKFDNRCRETSKVDYTLNFKIITLDEDGRIAV